MISDAVADEIGTLLSLSAPGICLLVLDVRSPWERDQKSLIAQLVFFAPSSNVRQNQRRHIFQVRILLEKKSVSAAASGKRKRTLPDIARYEIKAQVEQFLA